MICSTREAVELSVADTGAAWLLPPLPAAAAAEPLLLPLPLPLLLGVGLVITLPVTVVVVLLPLLLVLLELELAAPQPQAAMTSAGLTKAVRPVSTASPALQGREVGSGRVRRGRQA
jgi:hypothetical protein